MPILKPETELFPDNLLAEATSSDPERKWWAVYTKSRQEKAIARQLHGMDVPFYLPLVQQTSVIGTRRVKSLLPLFPSYMFVFGTDAERVATLSTQRVTQMICAPDTELMTKDLSSIRTMIAAGVPMTLESRLEAGCRVRVKKGSLMGLEGTIVTRRGSEKLLVAMQFLQQGVSIEINDYLLEAL